MLRVLSMVLIVGITYSECGFKKDDFGDKLAQLAKTLHRTCFDRTSIEQSQIDDLSAGNFNVKENMKDYINCLWTEATVIDENAVINYELSEELAPPKFKETMMKFLHLCDDKTKDTKITKEKVWEITKCFYDTAPDYFVMF